MRRFGVMGCVSGMVLAALMVSGPALAWGDWGHRLIGEEAMRALPDYMPNYLRSTEAVTDVGEFSREPDRWRNSGKVHDSDRDADHFIDLDDEGSTWAGLKLDELPTTLADYEAAVRAKGLEPYKSGFLPYAMVDAYQQVIKDFAYIRILTYLTEHETDKAKKAWYLADLARREALSLRDIGVLSHYVGDTTQPMHASNHYNGWGNYPNPDGFTEVKIHWPVEGPFVKAHLKAADIRGHLTAYAPCTDAVMRCFTRRINASNAQIIPLFQLEKAGGFKGDDPRGVAFVTGRIIQATSDLRDSLIDAWRDSKAMTVGFPGSSYEDIISGKVADPYGLLYGEG